MEIHSIRQKGRDILIQLFKKFNQETPEFFKKYEKYGINIEKSIYNETIAITKKNLETVSWENKEFRKRYAEIFRKVKINLTYTPNAKHLVNRLRNKEFIPTELPKMNHRELDPIGWAESDRQNLEKFKLEHHNPDAMPERQEGILTCGKCKSKRVSYTSFQTRSSDEPMTIFAECIECGNKWRQ